VIQETLPRKDLLSFSKFMAAATPAEWLKILGWTIDTRWLTIELPYNKHKAWMQVIDETWQKTCMGAKEIEAVLGRLNHAGFTISMARHFLGRLRKALYGMHRNWRILNCGKLSLTWQMVASA
jgi:hypothetical protein